MLKIEEIRELIKLIDKSSIDEFSYEIEGSKIKLRKKGAEVIQTAAPAPVTHAPVPQQTNPEAQAAPQEAPVNNEAKETNENLHQIKSPMVGTFYTSSNPESDAYVSKGSKVEEESIVCIVEAMKLFNEITADVKGEIVDILVENGQLVEYGQPLFLVKAE
ncbi:MULTISPECIES: acetyl-CoA carboxylase biotin carboxyl carrier protein [Bacillus]|uniref:Biotin carboxyl carrier protein of acetyl-CoA carboxylase n=2 Tax=Bacillus TaxID=1386 RepID=A0A0M4FX31_9BACI|nr:MULTISPECIES: acetyl-CoA carboxylase biotin carboxyl carrier protein [Bacillus]ALC81575.1 acetyl-CoA carboxylase [Bacillus gobiensis]MBP1080613.1 acetyl-CoA carboxylase biotin carboxyl carrier protein [Bacillus capparidis]MED1094469.1 acetyl-CoA carboxylase biotin carboxyl carrier protein [Bacillus capparidis]